MCYHQRTKRLTADELAGCTVLFAASDIHLGLHPPRLVSNQAANKHLIEAWCKLQFNRVKPPPGNSAINQALETKAWLIGLFGLIGLIF
jgi:hypothetical protein